MQYAVYKTAFKTFSAQNKSFAWKKRGNKTPKDKR